MLSDIGAIPEWCEKNAWSLNPGKTKLIYLSRKRDVFFSPYVLESNAIDRVSLVRYVGVNIDTTPLFTALVSKIVGSATRKLDMITRLPRSFTSPYLWCVCTAASYAQYLKSVQLVRIHHI